MRNIGIFGWLASCCLAQFASMILGQEPAALKKTTYVYMKVGEVEIAADVFRPTSDEPRPVVVWIHGGALIVGSRT